MNIRDKNEVRELITEACSELNYENHKLDNPEAVELLMGTWAAESIGGKYLKQLNGGPAISAWQIERPTYLDIIERVPDFHRQVLSKTAGVKKIGYSNFYDMEQNHKLACQVSRLKYWLSPGNIPLDPVGQAEYWKKYYNTYKGAGTIEGYIAKYKTYVA